MALWTTREGSPSCKGSGAQAHVSPRGGRCVRRRGTGPMSVLRSDPPRDDHGKNRGTTGGQAAAAMPSGHAWRVGAIRVVAGGRAGQPRIRPIAQPHPLALRREGDGRRIGRGRDRRINGEVVVRPGASRGRRASHWFRCSQLDGKAVSVTARSNRTGD
jgi:hypothetical protein